MSPCIRHQSSARRSCHDTTGVRGRPLLRSQMMKVDLWQTSPSGIKSLTGPGSMSASMARRYASGRPSRTGPSPEKCGCVYGLNIDEPPGRVDRAELEAGAAQIKRQCVSAVHRCRIHRQLPIVLCIRIWCVVPEKWFGCSLDATRSDHWEFGYRPNLDIFIVKSSRRR